MQGYGCCQSVLSAFADMYGLDEYVWHARAHFFHTRLSLLEQTAEDLEHKPLRQPSTTHLPFIGGGTSARKMMNQMFDLLDNDGLHYVNADVLWITDFLIPSPPQSMLDRFKEYRERGTRFYGIRIIRDDDKEPNEWKEYFNQIYTIKYRPLRRY